MKTFLKFFFSTIIGIAAGFSLIIVGITIFTDNTLDKMLENISKAGFIGVLLSCLYSITAIFIAIFLQIVIH